jgi:hypothetical protein
MFFFAVGSSRLSVENIIPLTSQYPAYIKHYGPYTFLSIISALLSIVPTHISPIAVTYTQFTVQEHTDTDTKKVNDEYRLVWRILQTPFLGSGCPFT